MAAKEKEKRDKAEGLALARGAVYVPFAANAALGFGPSAVACMEELAHALSERQGGQAGYQFSRVRYALSSAIAEGNCSLLESVDPSLDFLAAHP